MSTKSKIFVPIIVLAITGFIVYGTFNFFGHETSSPISPSGSEIELVGSNELRDGVYDGTALGYGGDVTTRITIKDGKIVAAEVTGHNETPEYFEHAKSILDSIVRENTYDVDIVAGCTVTSNAIKDGVHKAMLKARGQSVELVKDKNKGNGVIRTVHADGKTPVLSIPKKLKDGLYYGYGMGYNGTIKVAVRITGGKIGSIQVVSHGEDRAYFNKAVAVLDRMKRNVTNVDTVSGATITSRGLINAVNDALSKAGVRVKESNGGNIVVAGAHKPAKPVKKPVIKLPGKLKDGVFYGYGKGYNGKIKVAVKISKGKIADIKVIKHKEDKAYYDKAVSVIRKLKNGATRVDTVSGATITSKGLIDAVNDALSKAGIRNEVDINKPKPKPVPGPDDGDNKEPDFDTTQKLNDGVYYAEANGYAVLVGKDKDQNTFPQDKRTPVKIRLTVKDSKIYDIKVVSHNETPEYFDAAKKVIDDYLKGKNKIDSVTGATITSDALKTAVQDALKQAGYKTDSVDTYSDGTWYGQAYGFYTFDKWYVTESDDMWKTQTGVRVDIKDGKITDINLERFGDDVSYHDKLVSHNAYNLINEEVIRTNGVKSAIEKFVINKTSGTNQDTDAISGATFSGNAYINAIKDALNRSVKYSNDKVDQPIKSIGVLPHKDRGHDMKLPYGKPFNVGNFRVKVGYSDSKTGEVKYEIMLLKDAVRMGIEFDKSQFPGIDKNLIFTPEPDDRNDYTVSKYYDLKLTDPASGARALYKGIEGARELKTLNISEIQITGPDSQKVTVPWNDPESFNQTSDMPFSASEVKDVKVIDENGKVIELNKNENGLDDIQKNGFGIRPNQPNNLKIEIRNPQNPKDSPTAYVYNFKSLQITFNLKFNENDMRSVKIVTPPTKTEYNVGERLDLSGLKIQFVDGNNIAGDTIPFEDFEKNGIKVKNVTNGQELETTGNIKVEVEKTVGGKAIRGNFVIKVKEAGNPEVRVDKTIKFYDIKGDTPELIGEAPIPEEGDAKMEIPDSYFIKGNELANADAYKWVVEDQNGAEFEPRTERPYSFVKTKTRTVMMVYREGFDGPVKVDLMSDKRIDTKLKFYDMTGSAPKLIGEAPIPAEGDAEMEIPDSYFIKGNELANVVSYKWVVEDQNGKEFEPRAERPYSFVKTKTRTVMMVYREGFDGPVKVNLMSDKRVDTTLKFYDMTGSAPKLIGEAPIPAEGDAEMEIPDSYFIKGNELANVVSYKWVVEDQNGKEFKPRAERPYSFVKTKTRTVMMVYREGFDGPVKVDLISDKKAETSDV